jgi:hypothetical protein
MHERGTWMLVALVAACEARGPQAPEPDLEASGVAAVAAAAAGPVESVVMNTDANPVPTRATGTTAVAGTVAATQSGAWNVGISGTPAVAQSGAWEVGIRGAVSLAADTGVVARQGDAPWTVSLSGTPSVSIAGTPTVALAGTPSVAIASTPAAPVLVRNGDEPGRHAFQQAVDVHFGAGEPSGTSYFSIPAGKLLVVESVSAAIDLPPGQIPKVRLTANDNVPGASVTFSLAPTKLGGDQSFDKWEASHPLRIYQEGGPFTVLAADCTRSTVDGTYPGFVDCSFTISGYLIDL